MTLIFRDITDTSHVVDSYDSNLVLRYSEGAGEVIFAKDDKCPIGMQVAVMSVMGPVVIQPQSGVKVVGTDRGFIPVFKTGVFVKTNANFWLYGLGSNGGGGGGANPAPPELLTATAGAGSASLTWKLSPDSGSEPISNQFIEVSTDNASWQTVSVVNANVTSQVVNDLEPRQYWVRLRAVSAAGASDPSNTLTVTPLTPVIPDLVVTWSNIGVFKINNYDKKYTYKVTCTAGTGDINSSGLVTLSDQNTIAAIECTYFGAKKTKNAERKGYTNRFIETEAFHCDNCHGPCTGCCGGGTFHPGECGGWPDCYFACCTCGYYVGDDYRGQGYTWSGGSGSIPAQPDGNEWWKIS